MHVDSYFKEVVDLAWSIDKGQIEKMAQGLSDLRAEGKRLFVIGLGGSLANAIHLSADLRKLCDLKTYCPDNIAELTARINDEGMETALTAWMDVFRADEGDGLFVLSVGGGTPEVSVCILRSVNYAIGKGMRIFGITGPDGGYTAASGGLVIKVPAVKNITPHSEAFQAVIWHCLVSHPSLQRNKTKW